MPKMREGVLTKIMIKICMKSQIGGGGLGKIVTTSKCPYVYFCSNSYQDYLCLITIILSDVVYLHHTM